jgi:hypothetical protein
MSHTESDSDTKPEYQTAHGERIGDKNKTTDTDFYFNKIANPIKIIQDNENSETSELDSSLSSEKSNHSTKSDRSNRSDKSNRSEKNSNKSDTNYEKKTDNPRYSESRSNYEEIPISKKYNDKFENPDKVEVKQLTVQEVRMKKIELLRKLCEIKSKGFTLSKEYDFSSPLEEMEYEYELLKSFADKRNGVKVVKNAILQFASVVEFVNDKYDPFDFHLSGWTEHLTVESDNWEDVLEELYEKYKGTGKKMAPELKLLYLIIISAAAFHFTKANTSHIPGLDSVLANNPGLLSKILHSNKSESSQFMTKQELNIEKQRDELKKKDMETKKKEQEIKLKFQEQQNMAYQQQINSLQEQLHKTNANVPQASNIRMIPNQFPQENMAFNKPTIKAPNQVKDILNRIHNIQGVHISNADTQQESTSSNNNDRLIGDSTISETSSGKKKVKKNSQKPTLMVI